MWLCYLPVKNMPMKQADPTANQVTRPSPPAASFLAKVSSPTLRRWVDHGARGVITLGGWATIFSIFGIFAYLFIEVAPLFYTAAWSEETSVHLDTSR